jgi:hypothetical protein
MFRPYTSFRLRTFLIALMLLSVAICLIANHYRRRHVALARIQRAGGYHSTGFASRQLNSAFLTPGSKVERTWSEVVLGDSQHFISIIQRDVPHDVLSSIAVIDELRGLQLPQTDVDDAGVRLLARLRHLQTLDLDDCPITDASAEVIGGFSELRWLDLNQTKITDAAVPHLMRLDKLELLRVRHTELSDEGLVQLAGLKNLRELHFRRFNSPEADSDVYERIKAKHPQVSIGNKNYPDG